MLTIHGIQIYSVPREECPSNECCVPKAARAAFEGLRLSADGVCQLCNDGVLRSFSSTGQVLDYRKLSPEEINAQVEMFATNPLLSHDDIEKLRMVFKGVDGRDVDDSKCVEPDQENIPDIGKNADSVGERQVCQGVLKMTSYMLLLMIGAPLFYHYHYSVSVLLCRAQDSYYE